MAPAPTDHIDYSADTLDYEVSTVAVKGSTAATHSLARLRGHVWLKESTWTIRAGEVRMDLDQRYAHASGGLSLEDGLSQLTGKEGDFDLETHEGQLYDSFAEYPPWRIWARRGSLDAERRARFRRAYFTSCNVEPPHYHFTASRMRVAPNQWLYATNVLLYLGKIPLFYTPFLWKSLRPKHILRTRFSPGYDRRYGGVLRTTTLFSISPTLYGKLFLDEYGKQRPGMGSELQFHASREARGALYGYRIRERTGRERWTVWGDHYQTLGSSFAVQGRLQAQSDTNFNNDYQRSNSFRVANELVNNGAVIYRTVRTTTRLSYSRLDIQNPLAPQLSQDDPNRTRYIRSMESSPRLDFQTAQLQFKHIPALYTFTGFADNRVDLGQDFRQRSAGAGMQATQKFYLARGLVFTPRADFNGVYESRHDAATSFGIPQTLLDVYTGRYGVSGNLRYNTRLGDWDLSHAIVRRLKPSTFQDDAGALDYGMETNEATLQDTLRPNRKTLFRLKGGYNLQRFRDHDIEFRQRVEPLVADLIVTPRSFVQVSARDEYQLQEGNRSFLFQTDFGDRSASYIGLGFFHTLASTQSYIASTEFGLAPASSTWRLQGALRYQARSAGGVGRMGALALFEKELSIIKDFHDFHTRAIFRIRPGGVQEFLFRIELLLGKHKEEKIVRRDWESEWFPWRKEEDISSH